MKYFFSNSAVVILLCISLSGCNKHKNDPEPEPVVYNGVFSSSIYAVGNGTLLSTYFTADHAGITSNDLVHNTLNALSNLADAGNLSLNGVQFEQPHPSLHYYLDNSQSNPFTTPHVWSITGSETIPAFTFTNVNSYPIFEGYKNLPDSFHHSTGVVIPLTNYSNVDEIEVHFITTQGKVTNSKFFPANTDTIRISASEFPPTGPFHSVELYLHFYKNNKQVIDGNNYIFQTGYFLRKGPIRYN